MLSKWFISEQACFSILKVDLGSANKIKDHRFDFLRRSGYLFFFMHVSVYFWSSSKGRKELNDTDSEELDSSRLE